MIGTNYTTGGLRRFTSRNSPARVRRLGFVLSVICGAVALAWIVGTSVRQLNQLQRDYAASRSQSFHLGVTMRASIRAMNEKALQFRLSKDPRHQQDFARESGLLRGKILTRRSLPTDSAGLERVSHHNISRQLTILDQAEQAYRSYVAQTAKLFDPADPISFGESYTLTRAASMPFVTLCDELEKTQFEGFGEFLAATQQTLRKHQFLLQLSWAVILVLAAILAVLVYRGMIAPLRARLDQSQTIIERQEKLASLGILGSGVAHEIRNPLTAIKFRLFSLKKAFPMIAQSEDALLVDSEINRLERIVKDFLRFARPSDPQLASIRARVLLQEVENLLKSPMAQSGIDLRIECADEVLLRADAQQIKQVLINLVQNAADSIGQEGKVTLGVYRSSAELPSGVLPAAIFSVTDTGKGIPPEIEPRLFDPFFSTKAEGTGLGLATAARIVEKHGGVLRYKTELNRGSTFEVVLPELTDYASNDTSN